VFVCLECGHIFEEGEESRWLEKHGLDTPPYEEWSGCPICKGGYEEIEPCKICGSYSKELNFDCCMDCNDDLLNKFLNFVKTLSEYEKHLLKKMWEEGDEMRWEDARTD
jgi:hypothetical protein